MALEQKPLASLSIDPTVIDTILKQELAVGLARALGGDNQRLVVEAIRAALDVHVDDKGQPTQYYNGARRPFLEWFVGNTIRKQAVEVLQQVLDEQRAAIREAVVKALTKQRSAIANALVQGMADASSSSWRLSVNVGVIGDK